VSDAAVAPRASGDVLVRALVLRALGLVLAIAFASLWVQVDGLFGGAGIAPVADLLAGARKTLGGASPLRVPTLLWIDAGDAALHVLCAIGTVLGLALAAGRAPRASLAGAWLAYLSFASVGAPFLGYQWDALLLETALCAIVLASPDARCARAGLWLLRALLVKLMLLSGLVKLLSGDPTWRGLDALAFHYWTQPLPAWTSAFAASLPPFVQRASTAATLAVELLAPFGIFGPRRVRLASAAALAALQVLIAATGSYGFFNLLTLVLCVTPLGDGEIARALPARLRRVLERPAPPRAAGAAPPRSRRAAQAATLAFAGALLALSVLVAARRVLPPGSFPDAADELLAAAAPLRSVNAYGLFAVMTTERPEIELEGSRDGAHWEPYVFRWKLGPVERRPAFATPHMPRLDWQMWFAALGRCENEVWLHGFVRRLLERSPAVSDLLAHDPFRGAPPRYVRATLWRYRFAPAGDPPWWTRDRVGPYCPTLTLQGGRLALATELGE
jgi:hypothetical protein